MATDRQLCEKLRLFAESHGHTIRKVTEEQLDHLKARDGFSEAPFSHLDLGIVWEAREAYYLQYRQWPDIIHELGHLMATTKSPRLSVEWDFFGWEIALVHHIGAPVGKWLRANKDYGVNNGEELGTLEPAALQAMLAERLKTAEAAGLVIGGVPQAVR